MPRNLWKDISKRRRLENNRFLGDYCVEAGSHVLIRMEVGEFKCGGSEVSAVFPALTRAKQRFFERKAIASGAAGAPATPSALHKEPPQATGGDQAAVRRKHVVGLR